jgi:hypothetical protein
MNEEKPLEPEVIHHVPDGNCELCALRWFKVQPAWTVNNMALESIRAQCQEKKDEK